ncbi:response regulator [Oligoflexia bacterium]|nr:response regulator [Oligoflexia bacterium]
MVDEYSVGRGVDGALAEGGKRLQVNLRPQIVLVSQEPQLVQSVRDMLEGMHVEIIEAQSGEVALALSHDYELALALVDVELSEMDGIQTAEQLRANKETASLPIILMTANSEDQQRAFQGRETAAIEYLPKPINSDILVSKVSKLLELYSRTKLGFLLEELLQERDMLRVLQAGRNRALQRIIAGEGIASVLKELVSTLVVHYEQIVFYAILLNEDGKYLRFVSAPGLPDEKSQASSTRKTRVTEEELVDKPQWTESRELALQHGLHAHWSKPIISCDGRMLGGVTMYFSESQGPTAGERQHLNMMANLLELASEFQLSKASANRSRKQASVATEDKIRMMASMSHEIRTSLTAIVFYSEQIDQFSDEERDIAQAAILKNSRYLLEVVDDVLGFSGSGAELLDIEIAPCSFWQILAEVKVELASLAHAKGIFLGLEYQYPLPEMIETDPYLFKQMLVHIAKNAIDATENGGVTIVVGCDCDREKLSVAVLDTGAGIVEEQQMRLFDSFVGSDESLSSKTGETGLGRVLFKQFAERLGGSLEADSIPGKGCTFTLTIGTGSLSLSGMLYKKPNSRSTSAAQRTKLAVPHLEGHILVVDDDHHNRQVLSRLLSKTGVKVSEVSDGSLAVKEAIVGDFDLILMDLLMPVMDGFTATRLLRQAGYTKPIVAVTALAALADIEQSRAAGCNEHIPKPYERSTLYDVISKYLNKKATAEAAKARVLKQEVAEDTQELKPVKAFVEELSAKISSIQEAYKHEDWEALAKSAQLLTGAGLLGFPELGNVASSIEELARKESTCAIPHLIATLQALSECIMAGKEKLSTVVDSSLFIPSSVT